MGITMALNTLSMPDREVIGGEIVDRSQAHYVAKQILQVFPKMATRELLKMYKNADSITRGNIIRAAGNVAGGSKIKKLLIRALDDKEFCEYKYLEMEGEPLRVCDVAYNQLVLRYEINDALRTIGTEFRVEVRDYHIDNLKKMVTNR